MLSKSLIQLSADGWGYAPSLLVVWPVSCLVLESAGSIIGLLATSKKDLYPTHASQNCCFLCPCSHGRPFPTHASARDPPTHTGRFGSVSCGVTALFPWLLVCTRFCALQESLFPPVLWEFWNQIHCLSKSDSLGSPFARSPGWKV